MKESKQLEVEQIWSIFLTMSEHASKETLSRFRTNNQITNKNEKTFDPVTEADVEVERILRQVITEQFPSHGIIGEELPNRDGTSEWSWIIDPIDGTRSFVSGMPTWGTLVGVLKNGVPTFGMMSQPFVGELFMGEPGKSVTVRNGCNETLHCRSSSGLSDATLFTTSPDMFESAHEKACFDELAQKVKLTRYGADCYGYCLLAAGFVDLVVEANLGFYDIAPLVPIIEGAGGIVTDWQGGPIRAGGRALAAGDQKIHMEALATMSDRTIT